ncbi:MAG TPA: type II toxin-antitoxin system HicB family antitoxin [Planctomycetota bacterium]|nr:type II toxin-antitoxin system HicB family antitoxin [Planctomycetota bacterium]
MRYPIAIEWGDAKHAFGVVVPDLPGCFSAGDTLDEAISNAQKAITLSLEDRVRQGDAPPKTKPIKTHWKKAKFKGWEWAVANVKADATSSVDFVTHTTVGSVFFDLGLPPLEAPDLDRKSNLMFELERIVQRHKLNSVKAAKRFGVDRNVIKRLKSGDIDFFTVDLLIQMLERAGKVVTVVVSNRKRVRAV